MMRAASSILVGLAVLAPRAAAAAPEDTAVSVVYRVDEGCPDRAAFVRDVTARAERFRADDTSRDHAWTVTARRAEDGTFTGTLAIRDAEGPETVRDVRGATCSEVVSALALIGALTIGAEAAPPSPPAPPPPPSPPPPPPPPSPERGWQLAVAAGAALEGGVAPSVVGAFGGRIEIRARRPGGFSPSLSLGLVRSLETTTAVRTGGSATFVLTTGMLDLCPSRWATDRLSVAACLRGELGVLAGEGEGVTPPRADAPAWAALGALVRGELLVVSPVSLAVTGGPRTPLVRTRYIFQPDITVYEPPGIAGFAGFELVVRFL